MGYVIRDGARSTAAAARDVGGLTLIVQPGEAARFGTFGVGDLMRVSIFAPDDLVRAKGVLVIDGRDGPSLSVGGPFPSGATDFAVASGDVVECCPLAADLAEVKADVSQLRQDLDAFEGTPGPPGEDGADGAQGPPGTAATVDVGTVTTGTPGSSAAVTAGGTPSARVLNFTIPRGDPGAQGIQGIQGIQGATGAPGPNTISGLIDVPTDGSIVVESGAGTSASPYKLKAKRRKTIVWMVASGGAGATGDATDAYPAPFACKPVSARMYCRTNPTSSVTAQVKVSASNYLGSALSIAGGATGPVEATSGWAASTIAAGAPIVASWTALPSDARGVVVEFEILES